MELQPIYNWVGTTLYHVGEVITCFLRHGGSQKKNLVSILLVMVIHYLDDFGVALFLATTISTEHDVCVCVIVSCFSWEFHLNSMRI